MFRHDPDWLAFCCGVIFVGFGLAYVVVPALDVHIKAVWTLPVLLVALGVAGLIGTGRRAHRHDD